MNIEERSASKLAKAYAKFESSNKEYEDHALYLIHLNEIKTEIVMSMMRDYYK